MPKLIKQPFLAEAGNSPIDGGRRATPEDFGAGVGSALQGFGHTAQRSAENALSDMEQADTRKVLVSQAKLKQQYAQKLHEAQMSGADLDPIKEKFQQDLDAIRGGATTKRGLDAADYGSATSMAAFDAQVNEMNVERAATEARTQGAEFLSANGAILQSNPSYLPMAEAELAKFVETYNHRLPPQKLAAVRLELQQQLNVSAAQANARIDPEGTKAALEKGEWTLSAQQRQQATNFAEGQIRAKRADEDHARVMQEYNKRVASDKARDGYFKGIMDGSVKMSDVMADPDLSPQDREHLVVFRDQWNRRLLGEEKKSNPAEVRRLWLGVHDPDATKRLGQADIVAAVAAGGVNVTDADRLNTAVATQKDENNRTISSKMWGITNTIGRALSQDPRYTGQPELVAAMQNQYSADVEARISQLRKDKVDVNEAFNPASKYYVGSKEFITQSITQAKQEHSATGLPKPTTQEEYDAIGEGDAFIDTDGVVKIKPKGSGKPKKTNEAKGQITPAPPTDNTSP